MKMRWVCNLLEQLRLEELVTTVLDALTAKWPGFAIWKVFIHHVGNEVIFDIVASVVLDEEDLLHAPLWNAWHLVCCCLIEFSGW